MWTMRLHKATKTGFRQSRVATRLEVGGRVRLGRKAAPL